MEMHQVSSAGLLGEGTKSGQGETRRGEVEILFDATDRNAIHLQRFRNRVPAERQDPVIDSKASRSQAHLANDVFDSAMGVR